MAFNTYTGQNTERIAAALAHMEKYYSSDLALSDYAAMCNLSKYHFVRVFGQIMELSPLEYRNKIRLERATELLRDEYLSVKEVSNAVGYSSASYFSSAFKRKYGISPKQYQKKYKKH